MIRKFLFLLWFLSIFFILFDYYMTWTNSNGFNESNWFTRMLWLNYGKWILIPQLLTETLIISILFFGRNNPKLILSVFVFISLWAIYIHYIGGMSWL